MSQQKVKGILALPKNSILSETSPRTVSFEGLTKEQHPKTDISRTYP
jgi:hypothetical protein